jgi:hypothetical protein
MWRYFAVFLLSNVAFAQNSLTVTASRPTNAAADLAVLSVDVITPITVGRDEVFAAVQGSIVTPASFNYLRTTYQYLENGRSDNMLDWTFLVSAPIGNFKTTVTQLQALQQVIAQKKNGMTLSFALYGTQASPQAQQAEACSVADLLSDARAQAQKMAVAAGAGVGSVLAMSGATMTQPPSGALFSGGVGIPSCTMTVKFAMTGF